MAINFPDLPSINDIHVVGTTTYVWNGVAWVAVAEIPVGTQGVQGIQGAFGVQGRQGPSGPQGIQGVQGRQGPTGIQGITGAGVQGIQGLQGRQGTQGVQGPTGSQGLDGAYAAQGIQGPTGIQGNQGTTGAGTQGSTGAQGYTGIQGIQGRQGIAGQIGTQGVQGTQGIQGNLGVQGPFGPQGIAGEYAAQGIQGPQGLQGDTGIQGIQGLQGRQGTTGAQGTQGRQGTTGFQGTTGAQGIQGIYGVQGIQGTQGIQGPQGLDGAYAAQGIQGPTGIQGADGMQGTQGVQGPQGLQGTQGPQGFGIQGVLGTQGTQGVQGVQGTQGVQGLQGIQGPQGLDGAYAAQGIQGPSGPQGTQGVQGIQGPQGTQGVQGNLGIQGTQGIQGIQGPQGIQGIQGNLGIQGIQGVQGPQGVQGVQGIQGLAGTSFSGGAIVSSWNFNTSTSAADPGSQNFSVNNATLASVTAIYFNDTTLEGVDASVALSFLNDGNRIYIQQKNDVTRAALFEVDGTPTDNTGWWTVPVTVLEHNTTLYQSTQAAGTTLFFGGGGTGSGGATVTTADTPPVAPVDGDMWWNSTDGVLYVYYDDGNSQQWVVATPVTTGLQGVQGIQGPLAVGGTKNPDNLPVAPTAYDDEFDDNTLNTSKWTWRNQGTATATIEDGALYLTAPATASMDLKIIEQTLPGDTTWKYRAKVSMPPSSNGNLAGLSLVESSTGKVVTFLFVYSSGAYQQVANFTNVTTYSSTPATVGPDKTEWGGQPWFYFEIERNGSNLYYRFSRAAGFGPNNVGPYQLYTSSLTSFFTTAPDKIGLVAAAQNASAPATIICDWFRKIEAGYDVTKSSGGIQGLQGLQGVQGPTGSNIASGARVFRSTNQTISTSGGVVEPISFDTENYDSGSYYSGTNPTRFSISQSGLYYMVGGVAWDANTSFARWLSIRADGTTSLAFEKNPPIANFRHSLSTIAYLTAGQYVELCVAQDSGSDRTITSETSTGLPYFAISQLSTGMQAIIDRYARYNWRPRHNGRRHTRYARYTRHTRQSRHTRYTRSGWIKCSRSKYSS